MLLVELFENEEIIQEKISDKVKAGAMAAMLGTGIAGRMMPIPQEEPTPIVQQDPASQTQDYSDDAKAPFLEPADNNPSTITGSELESLLRNEAIKAGITGIELAQFLAQMKHESWNFEKMEEHEKFHGYFNRYDPKHKPAKARVLGNTHPGDGKKFRGRGFIQLTGRYNYKKFGELLGLDLVSKPDLAADPHIAVKIAIAYWDKRVKPNVEDFSNTRAVTRQINSALRGLDRRKNNFQQYLETITN